MNINQQDIMASETIREYIVIATRDRIYVLTEPGRELVKSIDFNYEGKESRREDALKVPYFAICEKVRKGEITIKDKPAETDDDEDSLLDQMRTVTPAPAKVSKGE